MNKLKIHLCSFDPYLLFYVVEIYIMKSMFQIISINIPKEQVNTRNRDNTTGEIILP
jgi:hypothetical protein